METHFGRGVAAACRRAAQPGSILDAAEAIFADFGTRASTEEVALRAGVAIGTVFRHFPTKDDLLAAIMKRLLAQLVEEAGKPRPLRRSSPTWWRRPPRRRPSSSTCSPGPGWTSGFPTR